jgi:hypothetical protein
MKKSRVSAFFLAFIPGAGHLYLNKKRGFVYLAGFIIPIFFGMLLALAAQEEEFIAIGLVFAFIVGVINMLDIVITLLKDPSITQSGTPSPSDSTTVSTEQAEQAEKGSLSPQDENERFSTILLSLIPGLGHFHVGLMNRGLTFLIGFFGLATMIIFLTAVTNEEGFIAFLGILPVIWIFNMFDIVQQLARKHRGEELVDRTILEDFEETRRQEGKKSKAMATILSIFPGAGHMYLGLQKRGLQLMAGFLFAIYILDILRLSIFLFLIPLIWFYSFFDALQKVSKHGEEELQDIPVVSYFLNHQRWIGIGLLLLGLYYMLDNILIPSLGPIFRNVFGVDLSHWYYNYFQMAVICVLLIGGGLKLIVGSKNRKG